jgi:RND family efflux transporter MFP subunit
MSSSTGAAPAAVVGAVASEPRLSQGFSASAADAGSATDFWSLLTSAQTSDQLCRAWLGILCQWVPGTQAGLLLLHDEGDRYLPAGVWPDPEQDMSYLADVAQEALVERRGVVREEASGLAQCAYPLLSADQAYGVVVLHVASRGDASVRDALRLLHWGAGWLVGLFDRRDLVDGERRLKRSALLQDALLGIATAEGSHDAGRWLVNRLAESLPCRRAMLAQVKGSGLELISVSGTATFEAGSTLLAVAREAMHEAVQSRETQVHPVVDIDAPGEGGSRAASPLLAASALADYAQEAQAKGVVALPLVHQGAVRGALLLDFDAPVATDLQAFLETLALALAPSLALHDQATQGWWAHGRRSAGHGWAELVGPRRPGLKFLAALGLVALLLAAVVPVDHRVRSPATVEGRIQRSVVAPFDGFIREAKARAGDRVKQGDVLARLDDRDLQLEAAKWQAEAELADRKLREVMAKGQAVEVRIAQAEAEQSRAELNLVREKLARVSLVAPFDGVVVRGDLSQQLGSPIETGKVLFEVAPLDAYRVVLKVDERDIPQIRQGQSGELVLAGLPGQHMDIRVSQVSPVANAEDGHNSFRVEASVVGAPNSQGQAGKPAVVAGVVGLGLQPGMEGVGKVKVGEHSLLWLGFHRIWDWARYTAWSLGL